jgi:2-polyprenyl-6-methoxyphenol hydroxylase-like FAD-dependent oxidoreductase
MRVVIIGAGIGGLCLAQGLKQAGIDVMVHERDARLDSRGQGYRIHIDNRGADGLRECLPPELYELFAATTGQPSRRITVVDRKLKQLREIRPPEPAPGTPGRMSTSVDRFVLRTILMAGLRDVVRFGREFVRYETRLDGSIRAFFASGGHDTGDVLVAADGVGSRIRGQYLPQAHVRDTGERVLCGRTPLTPTVRARLPRMLNDGFTAVVGSRRLGMALGVVEFLEPPDKAAARLCPDMDLDFRGADDYVMWSLAGKAAAFPASDDRLHAMDPVALHDIARRMVDSWHPDLRNLVDQATAERTFFLDVRTSFPFGPWNPSRVTLLGDAIHAMPPSRGSGANIALKDAARLCAQLRKAADRRQTFEEAVGVYEADMADYGFAAVRDSLGIIPSGGSLIGAIAKRLAARRTS